MPKNFLNFSKNELPVEIYEQIEAIVVKIKNIVLRCNNFFLVFSIMNQGNMFA